MRDADGLVLDGGALDVIRRHAAEAYPYECCGALLGGPIDRTVRQALPLPNTTDEGPRRRFAISASDYQVAEARADALGMTLVGFYHSHPDHPARPSGHDLEHAWPNLSYVIVAVERGQPRDLRSWRLRPDRSQFDAERLEVPEPAAADRHEITR